MFGKRERLLTKSRHSLRKYWPERKRSRSQVKGLGKESQVTNMTKRILHRSPRELKQQMCIHSRNKEVQEHFSYKRPPLENR